MNILSIIFVGPSLVDLVSGTQTAAVFTFISCSLNFFSLFDHSSHHN
jgi:hypothetical protein